MTTYIDFVPSARAPFQAQVTLDGNIYTLVVTWNLAGQRYYVNCYALDGTLVFCLPLIGSPTGAGLLAAVYDPDTMLATITTDAPHRIALGTVLRASVQGCAPGGYNGNWTMDVTGPSTLEYSPGANPGGPANVFGKLLANINIAGGYFASLLVYRQANRQFEVSP